MKLFAMYYMIGALLLVAIIGNIAANRAMKKEMEEEEEDEHGQGY